MGAPTVALARGLIRFPLDRPLSNRYWLVRAGESRADARDVVASNPVGKADLENSLTERGRQQAREAAKELQAYGVTAPILWYSIWAKATQTASVISDVMLITSERRNAEYTYLDGRGMGAFAAVIEVEKPLNPKQHGGLWTHQVVQHHLNPKPGARSWRFQFHRAREPQIQLRRIFAP